MEISVIQAILLGVCCYLCLSEMVFAGWIGQTIFTKPLVHAFFIGLILGDMKNAMIIGSVIQTMYLGQVVVGGVSSLPSINISIWIAMPIAMASGGGAEVAIAICLPFAVLESLYMVVGNVYNQALLHRMDALIDKGKLKQAYWTPYLSQIYRFLVPVIVVPAVCLAGSDAITSIVAALPAWVTGCINVFMSLLPLLGFMMLLSVLVKNKLHFVLFLFGFAMSKVIGLNTLTITIIAGAMAVVAYLVMSVNDQKEVA